VNTTTEMRVLRLEELDRVSGAVFEQGSVSGQVGDALINTALCIPVIGAAVAAAPTDLVEMAMELITSSLRMMQAPNSSQGLAAMPRCCLTRGPVRPREGWCCDSEVRCADDC
jgi:hypothetical protein